MLINPLRCHKGKRYPAQAYYHLFLVFAPLAWFFEPPSPNIQQVPQSATFSRKQAGSCKHGAKPAASRCITIILVAVFTQRYPGSVVGIKRVLLERSRSSASQPLSCLLNQHVVGNEDPPLTLSRQVSSLCLPSSPPRQASNGNDPWSTWNADPWPGSNNNWASNPEGTQTGKSAGDPWGSTAQTHPQAYQGPGEELRPPARQSASTTLLTAYI